MLVVEQLGIVFGFASFMAMLSFFLEFCFREGNIFEPYYDFISRHLEDKSFWFKPLGGCIVCMNVWLCMLTFPGVVLCTGVSWLWCLAFILLSNTILRILIRIVEHD